MYWGVQLLSKGILSDALHVLVVEARLHILVQLQVRLQVSFLTISNVLLGWD